MYTYKELSEQTSSVLALSILFRQLKSIVKYLIPLMCVYTFTQTHAYRQHAFSSKESNITRPCSC